MAFVPPQLTSIFLSFSQNTNQAGIAGGCGGVGQSRRRLAPRQTRLSCIRVAGNSTRKHHLLGKSGGHVVAWRYSVHNACGKVSYLFTVEDVHASCLRLLGNGKSHETSPMPGRGCGNYFFFCFRLLTLRRKKKLFAQPSSNCSIV